MNEQFETGDKVVFEDAYSHEIKYGVITNLNGTDAVIRIITSKEAGDRPKRLSALRIACSFAKDESGIPVCLYHRKPLTQLAVHGQEPNQSGIGHFSAWICEATGKQLYDAGF